VHRSALGALCIDVPTADVAAASAFWQAALGRTARQGTTHPEFEVLAGTFSGMRGIVQDVHRDAPGVHLDLHTDDLETEVTRLCSLGARDVARHGGWAVLEDPAGMRFCVVPVDGDDPLLADAATFGD
jgi:predicted enzyme related to lactoylglutathione lyase